MRFAKNQAFSVPSAKPELLLTRIMYLVMFKTAGDFQAISHPPNSPTWPSPAFQLSPSGFQKCQSISR
jgi:hypothetical protein